MQRAIQNYSRASALALILATLAILTACSAGYVARLAPPSPEQYLSAVDFATSYTGGRETLENGARAGSGHMCGMPVVGSRRERYYDGLASICARKNGAWNKPICSRGMDVLFVAGSRNNQKRVCNADLEDFFVFAYEAAPGVSPAQFTSAMAETGHKSPARAKIEMQANAEAAAKNAEAAAKALDREATLREQQRIDRAKNQALARERSVALTLAFRKSVSVGTTSNCGPVVELRQNLAKVYFPVQGYGNEHWIDVNRLMPDGFGCRFINGQYWPDF